MVEGNFELRAASYGHAAKSAPPKMTLASRFYKGVVDHLRLRLISWVMSMNMIVFGFITLMNPESFSLSGHGMLYAGLVRFATAHTWGLICITIGGFRFVALCVNGTFPRFTLSPYVRALGSFLSCLFWLQIELGALHSGELVLALDVFGVFLVFDGISLYTAALEMDSGDGGA